MTTAPPRFGIAGNPNDPAALLDLISRADAAGVQTAWSTMSPMAPDTPTLLAAALATTERITVGTAIVPLFTRHPLTLALQAQALERIAPGRLRLGVGTGNLGVVGHVFHQDVSHPLERLREYLGVLRSALYDGRVAQAGDYYGAEVTLSAAPETPVLAAALGPAAFRLAGELTDGALAWLCPVDYLLDVAVPAVANGAASAGRSAPPVIGHVPVAIGTDRATILARAGQLLAYFGTVAAYRAMFAAAGFPFGPDDAPPEALLDELVVSGTPDEIATQLRSRADRGLPELIVSLLAGSDPRREEDQLLEVLASLA